MSVAVAEEGNARKGGPELAEVQQSITDSDALWSKIMAEADSIGHLKGGWSLGEGLRHLVSVQPRFKNWVLQSGLPRIFITPIDDKLSHFASLAKIIVFQQVSIAAGKSIFDKVLAALNVASANELEPKHISNAAWGVTLDSGRQKLLLNGSPCGLSESKARYLRSLSSHFEDKDRLGCDLESLSEDQLMQKLLAVQGLGLWSVHMYLMFHLQKGNVLALGDLGVRRGIAKLYDLGTDWRRKKEADFRPFVANWTPFSSLGSALMWKAEDVSLLAPLPLHDAQSTSSSSKRKTGDDSNPLPSKKRR